MKPFPRLGDERPERVVSRQALDDLAAEPQHGAAPDVRDAYRLSRQREGRERDADVGSLVAPEVPQRLVGRAGRLGETGTHERSRSRLPRDAGETRDEGARSAGGALLCVRQTREAICDHVEAEIVAHGDAIVGCAAERVGDVRRARALRSVAEGQRVGAAGSRCHGPATEQPPCQGTTPGNPATWRDPIGGGARSSAALATRGALGSRRGDCARHARGARTQRHGRSAGQGQVAS